MNRKTEKKGWMLAVACCLFASTGIQAQTVTPNELAGTWTLQKVEVVTLQGSTVIDTQSYLPAIYTGMIYFETIQCSNSGAVVYSGKGDQSLLLEAGKFHTPNSTDIVFQNSKIGYVFNFLWNTPNTVFVLEKKKHVSQENNTTANIRYFYQKQ